MRFDAYTGYVAIGNEIVFCTVASSADQHVMWTPPGVDSHFLAEQLNISANLVVDLVNALAEVNT